MMRLVVLAVSDATLAEAIARALPPGTGLKHIELTTATHFPSRDDLPADIGVMLIQADQGHIVEPWIQPFLEGGIPVVAIISDASDRENVFRAGVHDYILEPLVASEVQARILPYLRPGKMDRKGVAEDSVDAAMSERLSQQLVQNERWIAMGRVIAAICHDITNRMQAAQGALTLAAEEPSLTADLQAYLDLAMQETRRTTAYIQRLRRVYHPETDTWETINVHGLLSEVRDLASDAAVGGTVKVEAVVAPGLPPLRCRAGQLEFILLGTLLNLIDLISAGGPARVRMEAITSGSEIRFEISTDSPLADWVQARRDVRTLEHALGLVTFRNLVAAQSGKLGFARGDSGLKIWISLPTISSVP